MRRRISILAAAISLFICAASAVLWVRSQHRDEGVYWFGSEYFFRLDWCNGELQVAGVHDGIPGNYGWFTRTGPDHGSGQRFETETRLGLDAFRTLTHREDEGWRFGGRIIRWFEAPIWMVSLATAVLPSLLFMKFLRRRIGRTPMSCPNCSYNLTGNTSGTCPECGSAIPSSMATSETKSPRPP